MTSEECARFLTPLTHRERQILTLGARGYQADATADALGISRHTVNEHRKLALKKLDRSFIEVVVMMTKAGWL
jgi:DNA-binding CsgD family transcriptional regulator